MPYIFVGNEVQGPFETHELEAAVAAETINAETLVWNDQGGDWIALGQSRPELFSREANQPTESDNSATESCRW